MQFKDDVSVRAARPELVLAIMVTNDLFRKHNAELVVTSIGDGQHQFGSRHYDGAAFDFRVYHLDRNRIDLVIKELKEALTKDYDVVLESDHGHVEYQPK